MKPTWPSIRAKAPHRAGAVAVTAAINRLGPSAQEGQDEIEDFASTFRGALHFAGVYVACDPRGADQTRVVKGIYQKVCLAVRAPHEATEVTLNTQRPEKSVKKMLEALVRLGYSDVETSGTMSEIVPSVTARSSRPAATSAADWAR